MTTIERVVRHKTLPAPKRYAVLLNACAKQWNGAMHQSILRYVSSRDLFLTDTFAQAKRTVERLLQSDYDAIFTGGGDGTIMFLVNAVEQAIRAGKLERDAAPPIGVLKLGTGNALAYYLGSGEVLDDLRALREGAKMRVHEVSMLEGEDGLFPFAGLGLDADIVNDYSRIKDVVRDTSLEGVIAGLPGYWAAILGYTIPRAVRQTPPVLTIRNKGPRALRIQWDGTIVDELGPGELMYRGPARICGASTVPYWGAGVRMFPHADVYPELFQLRAYHGGVRYLLTHIPDFWQGKLREEDMEDFLVSHVSISMDGAPMNYQIGGDAAGLERAVSWQLAPYPVQLAVPLAS
jgi:diacylglycerol kinase family enzyme